MNTLIDSKGRRRKMRNMNTQEPFTAGVHVTIGLCTTPQLRACILSVLLDEENRYEARIIEKSPLQFQPVGLSRLY